MNNSSLTSTYHQFMSRGVSTDKIDLSDIDNFSYSAIMRKLNEKAQYDQVLLFMKLYKEQFDRALLQELQSPDKVALLNTIVKFNKIIPIKLSTKLIKSAAITELGNAQQVGQYLANIIKFTLSKISDEKRPKSINSVKTKIYFLNENEIAAKKMPASASMGQAITFVKHVLFNQNPVYIRQVLNNIVRYL